MAHEQFKRLLDQTYAWPAEYRFKFVFPKERLAEVEAALPQANHGIRASKSGKYLSLTTTLMMNSAEEVLHTHERVADIEGLLSL